MTGCITSQGKPYFVIDDFFTEEETNRAVSEFDTVLRPLMRRDATLGACADDGTPLKNTNALFLEDVYRNYESSPCFQITRKYQDKKFVQKLGDFHWLFTALQLHEWREGMQLIYYDYQDEYKAHYDSCLFTYLWWLAPEKVSGGDLVLDNNDIVKFKHNRVVIFPVQTLHRVTPVKSKGRGRYCVSNFLNLATYN